VTADAVRAGLPAATDRAVTLLVLGSLPGEKSLAARQYYANPTNQFWRLMGGVIEEDLRAMAYPMRLATLAARGIGLWDVIGSARRTGSLDSGIRDHQANDLRTITDSLPALRAIAFNGGTASAIGRKQLGEGETSDLVDLPSSSAAYCAISFDAKQQRWQALRPYIGKPQ
jgi:TDG/mug DNA glycosylase family protein